MSIFPRASHPCLLGTLLLALVSHGGPSTAHDWTSPKPSRSAPHSPQGWTGQLWGGPRSGPPAAPDATDCDRAPQAIDLPGPPGAQRQVRRDYRGEVAESPAPATAAPRVRDEAAKSSVGASAGEREHDSVANAARRAEAAPVSAGVVDDNADFGSFLAFHKRHAGLSNRSRDVSERYLLSVQDSAGRPVPDAEVQVLADARGKSLWARTDAGGQVWLHPRVAELNQRLLEVQVRKSTGDGMLSGTAVLQRGQRDALQVRLDGEAAPERARLDLVFLVDATGSMGDEIHKLRSSMQAMADQIAHLPSRPQICFGLVAYRDRGDEFFVRAHDFTQDLEAFQGVLAGLQAGGGGDYAEALNEGLHTAVHRLSWRGSGATRLILTVGDAPPHLDYGSPWYDDDMQGALARGIKLFTLGASGLDRTGELVFRQMAQYTGGRFVFLTYADARRPSSGPGRETTHDVHNYSVETLDKLVVRLVREELARRPT